MIRERLHAHARWLRDLPARTTLKLFNHRHVRTHLRRRYEAALDAHRPLLPKLEGLDREIVDTLDREGVFMTSLAALWLPDADELVDSAEALAHAFAPTARSKVAVGEDFVHVPSDHIRANPSIYFWGLNHRLLDIAEAYLGLPPAYDGVLLSYTVADGREVSTRKWHRDWEDRRMLKIAIYLHDVDDAGGPFEAIRRQDSAQSDADGFSYELADNDELAARLGASFEDAILSCVGRRGTVIFTDTARFFHRGKPTISRDRAALFYSYFARPPRHPFLCERTSMKRAQIAKLARHLPERQRQAAMWRRSLHPLLRFIPPASL